MVRPVGQPGLPVPDAGHPGAARHVRHDLRYGLGRAALAGQHRQHLAAFLATRGGAAAVILAVVLAVVAAGIYLPPRARRAVLVLAIVTAGVIWLARAWAGC